MITIPMKVESDIAEVQIGVSISDVELSMGLDASYIINNYPSYDGPYYVTPSGENQILYTDGFLMGGNVIVYAIETMTDQQIHDAVAAGWV